MNRDVQLAFFAAQVSQVLANTPFNEPNTVGKEPDPTDPAFPVPARFTIHSTKTPELEFMLSRYYMDMTNLGYQTIEDMAQTIVNNWSFQRAWHPQFGTNR